VEHVAAFAGVSHCVTWELAMQALYEAFLELQSVRLRGRTSLDVPQLLLEILNHRFLPLQ